MISLDVGQSHLLCHPFWPPRLALLVPVALRSRNIWMGSVAPEQLAVLACVLLVLLAVAAVAAYPVSSSLTA